MFCKVFFAKPLFVNNIVIYLHYQVVVMITLSNSLVKSSLVFVLVNGGSWRRSLH